MALQGSLSDFGIAEILQLIGSQQKTGVLHVEGSGETQEVLVYFSSGRIIRVEVTRRDRRDLLGQMLLAAEIIDEERLNEALREQKKSLQRLGDILIASGAAKREVVEEFTDLQMRETLYRLFEWKSGGYRFESRPPNFARPSGTPLSSESILMEGFRMMDEWPLIRAKISNFEVAYRASRPVEELETEAQALERILDHAFSEFAEPSGSMQDSEGGRASASKGVGSLGKAERRLLSLIDGQRDVYSLIDHSRLGEFETCKALVSLLDDDYIAPVKTKRPQESPGRRRETTSWRALLARGSINAAALIALVLAVTLMPQSRQELAQNAALVFEEAAQRLRANWVQFVASALEVYRLQKGSYPDTLEALVQAGLLEEVHLGAGGDEGLEYIGIGFDYSLR